MAEWVPSSLIAPRLSAFLTSTRLQKLFQVSLDMPQFSGFPFRRRYDSLRLLGYDYNSIYQLCAISLVTELRRPLFADLILAKAVLADLLSEQNLGSMRVRAFTLMPDHLHFLAGVREPEIYL